jgi:hypothetical protein
MIVFFCALMGSQLESNSKISKRVIERSSGFIKQVEKNNLKKLME